MRDSKERLRDMLEAIDNIERYGHTGQGDRFFENTESYRNQER